MITREVRILNFFVLPDIGINLPDMEKVKWVFDRKITKQRSIADDMQ